VNAWDTKNLPGRKSDVQESPWLMKSHTYDCCEFVPAITGDSRDADLLAAAQRSGAECGSAYSADAQGADADESAIGNVLTISAGATGQASSSHSGSARDAHKLAEFRIPG